MARTAVELLEVELERVACAELLLLTEPSEDELLLLTVVPEALLLERVPEALDPLLEERVTCWLLLPEVLLVVLEEPEVERVACWLLPLEERVWAIISGAATRDRAISTVAAIVIKRLIASKF